LCAQEKYLLELRGSGLVEAGAEDTGDDPILSVHPECDVITS
jgi:DNA replication licensing factor MCM6